MKKKKPSPPKAYQPDAFLSADANPWRDYAVMYMGNQCEPITAKDARRLIKWLTAFVSWAEANQ